MFHREKRYVLRNNLFALRLAFKFAPQLVLYGCGFNLLLSISWFLEHVLGFQYIMEAIEKGKSFKVVIFWIAVIWLITVIQHAANAVYAQIIKPKYEVILTTRIREMFYQKAWTLDLGSYDDTKYYNEFIWSLEDAPKRVIQVVISLQSLVKTTNAVLLSGAFFLTYDKLGLLFIGCSFIGNSLCQLYLNKKNFSYQRAVKTKERERNYYKRVFYLSDYAKELRLTQISSQLKEAYKKTNTEIRNIMDRNTRRIAVVDFIRQYIFNSLLFDGLYILYLVYKIIITQSIPFSSFLSLYRSSTSTKNSLMDIADVFTGMHENSIYIDKIKKFLDTEPKICKTENPVPLPEKIREIEFRHVSFRYDDKKEDVLHDISFTVKAGEHVSIVGYNGAGKSTLVKLLMRLYDVSEGEILVNGINIKQFDPEDYRRRFASVFQNFQIYAMSIAENVKMDEVMQRDMEDILVSLKRGGFSEKLEKLPESINTPLSRELFGNGIDLSGGEKQKVAISRMFYKNGDVLVLDEPSSALDPISEYEFYQKVADASDGKMLFTVSHRLASTKDADKILVMQSGRILESGTHDELMRLDAVYANMFRLQAEHYRPILNDSIA